MISPTQTMEHTTEVEYISIYDKPKKRKGYTKKLVNYQKKKHGNVKLKLMESIIRAITSIVF